MIDESTKISQLRFIILVSPLVLFSALLVDLYVPALPKIAADLGSTESAIQLSVSVYLFVLAISQLIYGITSDIFGRRLLLLLGLIILTAGSIICFFSSSINTLYLGRALQGFGAGAGITLSRAIGRDSFDTHDLVRIFSWINISYAIGPSFAPALGGYLSDSLGWQAIFVFTTIYTIVSLLMVYFGLRETNTRSQRIDYNFHLIFTHHIRIASNKSFLCNLISASASHAGLFILR